MIWLESVASFTIEAITSIPHKISILYNLIFFWAYFVPYVHSINGESTEMLNMCLYKITCTYIESKLSIMKIDEEAEDENYKRNLIYI